MKQIKEFFIPVILLGMMLVVGCGTDPEVTPTPEFESRLISNERLLKRPASEITNLLGVSTLDIPLDRLVYDVTMYRVNYSTTYKGQELTVSGMVFLPDEETPGEAFPMLSWQHGTIASNAEAPSEVSISSTSNLLYYGIAGAGAIVVIPDFIGFGASEDVMHPYYVEEATAQAIVDMIRAGGELALEQGLTLSNSLYLAGYSQGGYATMATHKYIETEGMEWYELKKSYPSSGGYDIIGMRDFFFAQTTYEQPFFLAYVAEAYRTHYDWSSSDMALLFNQPYASAISGYFDGTLNGGAINELLTYTISELVTEGFLTNPDASTYDFVNQRFEENSLLDWTPTIPMAMYHGDADIWVDYQNSVNVYNHFIENGASTDIVTFTPIEGGTHPTAVAPYIELFLNDLILQVDQNN